MVRTTLQNVDKKIIKYLGNKPQGAIIQNFVDDLNHHRFTIQKRLLYLMYEGKIEEIVYTQNCKVYRLKRDKNNENEQV